ncbi:hypothetical protein MHYP_G00094220 [Metynnis hypsauchen]
MGHVSSTPVHGEVKTRGKKRFIRLLSPDALSAKRRKLIELASGHHFEGVTVHHHTRLGERAIWCLPFFRSSRTDCWFPNLQPTTAPEVSSMKELQAVVLTCFYVAYAYIGHELGYPAMPFIMEDNSNIF